MNEINNNNKADSMINSIPSRETKGIIYTIMPIVMLIIVFFMIKVFWLI